MNTYYFNLHRVYEDGSADIHVEQVDKVESGARNLGNGLHDLPSGTGLWHGYIEARTPEEAKAKVQAAY